MTGVQAQWQGEESALQVHITRGWFQHNAVQRIRIDHPGGILLTPQGLLEQVGEAAVVSGDTLNVILPLETPNSQFGQACPFPKCSCGQWNLDQMAQKGLPGAHFALG